MHAFLTTWSRRHNIISTVFVISTSLLPSIYGGEYEELIALQKQVHAHRAAGRHRQALPLAKKLVALAERSFSNDAYVMAVVLNDLGNAYEEQGYYAKAEPYYLRSLNFYKKTSGTDHPDVASSLKNLASLYEQQGHYQQAESTYKEALAILDKGNGKNERLLAITLNGFAILKSTLGEFAEAEQHYRRALRIREKEFGPRHGLTAAIRNNLGNYYSDLGQYEAAVEYLQIALADLTKAYGRNHPKVALTQNALGTVFKTMGRRADAELLYQQALATQTHLFGEEHPLVADTLTNLAILYSDQGNLQKAGPLYERTLRIRKRVFGEQHIETAYALHNLGAVHKGHGQIDDAIELFRQSISIREKVFGPEHLSVANSLNSLANLYADQARNEKAKQLYQRSLAIRRESLGANHPDVADCIQNLAIIHRDTNELPQAMALINQAISLSDAGGVSSGELASSYRVRATIARKQGEQKQAFTDLDEAMQLAEQHRIQSAGGERSEARAFARFASIYEMMIDWRAEAGEAAKAFQAAERSRSQSLQDQMAVSAVDLLSGMPDAEAKRLRQQATMASSRLASLQQQVRTLNQQKELSETQRQQRHEQLQKEIKRAQADSIQAHRDIRNASPAYRLTLARARKPVALAHIRETVTASQGLLLQYTLGSKRSYLFVVPGTGDVQVIQLVLNEQDARALGTTPGPITSTRMNDILGNQEQSGVINLLRNPGNIDQAIEKLSVLYRILIPAEVRPMLIDDSVKSLTIIPDSMLSQLPFEALVVEGGQRPAYLLDVGPPINYAPSSTVLFNLANRKQSRPGRRSPVLTLADPKYDNQRNSGGESVLAQLKPGVRYGTVGGHLQRLPYSSTESQWVADVFGKNELKVGQLLGESATEAQLRFNASDRQIIHLACHGLVDQDYGNFFGALALTPGPQAGNNAADDGYLTLPEIYQLDLNGCELAILSACQTNFGPRQKGEGVWALSRGFLVAGARRVVASNWLVDDEAAASLVSYFCAGIAQAEGKQKTPNYATSLHAAKKWVRSQQKWSSPYYWGTFVLVGPQ